MFWKKEVEEPRKVLTFDLDEDERFLQSVSENNTSKDIYSDLKQKHEYHGDLLITGISDESIEVTTVGTIHNKDADKRIERLSEMIGTHVKGRASVGTKVYLITAEGEPAGLFNEWPMANFKKMALMRVGVDEVNIEIKEMYVE